MMNCPRCNAELWDNRQKKATDPKWAKSPEFTCKNKCGWNSNLGWTTNPSVVPPPSPVAAAPYPPAMPSVPIPELPATRDTRIISLFWDSFDNVLDGVAKRKLTDLFRAENLASLVATQFIQRAKG